MRWLALDIEEDSVQIAILEGKPTSFTIKKLFSLKTSLFTEEFVKQLYKQEKPTSITSAINPSSLLVKSLSLEYTKKRGLQKILPFQIETSLTLPLEECLYKVFLKKPSKEKTEISLLVIKKENLISHLKEMENLHLDPDIVSSHPSALGRFAKTFIKENKPIFIVHLGWKKSLCALIDNGIPIHFHTWKGGIYYLLEALHLDKPHVDIKDLSTFASQVDLLDLQPQSHLFSAISNMKNALSKLFFSMKKIEETILFTGQIQSFLHIEQALSNQDLAPQNIDNEKKKYALSIGLALDSLYADKQSVQFRQKEFLSTKQKKQFFKTLLSYLGCTLILSVLFFMGGQLLLQTQENKLRNVIEKIRELEPNVPLVDNLENQLQTFEENLEKEKIVSSSFLSFPKVSDTLAWIQTFKEKPYQILHFHYELLSSSSNNNLTSFDGVRIEMEFESPPNTAHNFHEWIEQSPMVNTKKEIHWEVMENHYKTSFFLQRKKI